MTNKQNRIVVNLAFLALIGISSYLSFIEIRDYYMINRKRNFKEKEVMTFPITMPKSNYRSADIKPIKKIDAIQNNDDKNK